MHEFNPKQYKIYTWKNWMVLHYIINPGIAFNEIFLGMRVPKVSLVDKTQKDKTLIERSYVPCPHCNTIHDARLWSANYKTHMKNWFGLYCVSCGKSIPCLMNATTFLLKWLTFPIWYWFKDNWKAKWLAAQPKRFENIDLSTFENPYGKNMWLKQGLSFGLFMFVFMNLITPLIDETPFSWKKVLISIPIWLIAGLGFGYFMKLFLGKKIKNS